MPGFSRRSSSRLITCHPKLVEVFIEVVKYRDCTVLEGFRPQEIQDEYYRTGRSQLKFPNGKHNVSPSMAVDVVPYYSVRPNIRWDDMEGFAHFAGFVMGIAQSRGIVLRWGGNWDMDDELHDSSFIDAPHFELVSFV